MTWPWRPAEPPAVSDVLKVEVKGEATPWDLLWKILPWAALGIAGLLAAGYFLRALKGGGGVTIVMPGAVKK